MDRVDKIIQQFEQNQDLYSRFKEKLEVLIKELIIHSNIKVQNLSARVKEREKLIKKIESKGDKYQDISEITDLVGLRIICYLENEVDQIAEIIKSEFKVDYENSIDKRKLKVDQFGYKSLHYVIQLAENRQDLTEFSIFKDLKAEIQIPTVLQHAWAEIEHDLGYKTETEVPEHLKRQFFRLAALLELGDGEFTNLKSSLTVYEKDISKLVKSSPGSITLDKISLKTFLTQNSEVIELDTQILNEVPLPGELILEDSHLERHLNELKYWKISNLEELEKLLNKYKEDIVQFYREYDKGWIDYVKESKNQYSKRGVPRGISITFLSFLLGLIHNDVAFLESYIEFKKVKELLEFFRNNNSTNT